MPGQVDRTKAIVLTQRLHKTCQFGVVVSAFTIRERALFMFAFLLLLVCKIVTADLSVKPDQLIPNLNMVEMFRGQLIN